MSPRAHAHLCPDCRKLHGGCVCDDAWSVVYVQCGCTERTDVSGERIPAVIPASEIPY